MKLVLISDTHAMQPLDWIVPEGDVLIHAGDLAAEGTRQEVQLTLDWLNKQPHEHILCVAGNHDWAIYRKTPLNYGRVEYLQDSSINIDGVNFHGSPWQPEFMKWAFNLERSELKPYWDMISPKTDVLITHSPPAGIMDAVRPLMPKYPRAHAGCDFLLEAVKNIQPKVHVFGHIHSGYGMQKFGQTTFVNASICDEAYRPLNKPFVIEI